MLFFRKAKLCGFILETGILVNTSEFEEILDLESGLKRSNTRSLLRSDGSDKNVKNIVDPVIGMQFKNNFYFKKLCSAILASLTLY